MTKMYTYLGPILLALCSIPAMAADIPGDVIDAEKFNSQQCIDNNTQDCINDQCLTSEATDCQANCADLATAKCKQQSD